MAFGIGFEMPVATVLVIATGMSTREDLAKKRPYVLVSRFYHRPLLTPPDVLSQLLLAIPMWLLFEVGLVAEFVVQQAGEYCRPGT
ncbi:MAG: twin-arginine translocase subunit TatC [Thiolinea sp.]